MKAAKDRKLDEAMAIWFMQKHSEGVPISGPILMAKSLEIHVKMYPNGGEEFKASTGWLRNSSVDTGSVSLQYKVRH